MRFVRYQVGREEPRFGWVFEENVGPIEGTPFGEYRRLQADLPLERIHLLTPVVPSKIISIGRNYVEHAKEQNAEVPEIPIIFLKPPSSVIGPGDPIILPPQSRQVEHEAELAIVIGKKARWLEAKTAMNHILGYTIGNDITARDLQRRDGQWSRGKGFDTFCPLGPWIETDLDPTDALITCRVDTELRQMASTREMVFTVTQILVFISSIMTLFPGDIILTGTPAGVGILLPGNLCEVTIEGIGVLRNPVRQDIEHPAA